MYSHDNKNAYNWNLFQLKLIYLNVQLSIAIESYNF